jgi:hypothetical protein
VEGDGARAVRLEVAHDARVDLAVGAPRPDRLGHAPQRLLVDVEHEHVVEVGGPAHRPLEGVVQPAREAIEGVVCAKRAAIAIPTAQAPSPFATRRAASRFSSSLMNASMATTIVLERLCG